MKHFVCRIWHRIIRGKKVQTLYYVQEDLTSGVFRCCSDLLEARRPCYCCAGILNRNGLTNV